MSSLLSLKEIIFTLMSSNTSSKGEHKNIVLFFVSKSRINLTICSVINVLPSPVGIFNMFMWPLLSFLVLDLISFRFQRKCQKSCQLSVYTRWILKGFTAVIRPGEKTNVSVVSTFPGNWSKKNKRLVWQER